MEVLQRTANRGSISTGGYEIGNSLKLERANSEQVRATGTTDSGNRKTWTFSTWIKRTEISYNGGFGINALFYAASTGIQINSNDKISIRMYNGSSYTGDLLTTQVFRDTSAWYHIVWTLDTTEATASNRIKLWINGQQVTDFDTETYPSLNDEFQIGEAGAASPIRIGNGYWGTSPFSAYIAETHYLNGTAKQASDFGEYDADSGIWIPKEYTDGGYGDIGFYYKFDNASSLGEDSSGEGHDANGLVNVTSADQATDTPTNNFCTINPLINYYGSVSEGATKFLHTSGGDGWESFVATMGAGTSGKWYAEFKFVASGSVDNFIGICPIDDPDLNRGADHFPYYGADTSLDESVGYYAANGQRYIGGGGSAYGNTWAVTNIMSIAVDMDNGKLYFAKDGVWQNSGDPTSGATGTGALDVRGATKPQSLGAANYTAGQDILANYGGYTTISISSAASDANGYGTFEYAPPTGYYALCSKNLAEYG